MAQSANRSSNEQYLQVVAREAGNPIDDSKISKVDALWIDNVLFSKVSPLFYKTRVHLSFTVSEDFKNNFVLIKGLIEFHRSRRFSFEYNLSQRIIETDVDVSTVHELRAFLGNIAIWVKGEINFKRNLKIILEFENQYKLAKEQVYSLIYKGTE